MALTNVTTLPINNFFLCTVIIVSITRILNNLFDKISFVKKLKVITKIEHFIKLISVQCGSGFVPTSLPALSQGKGLAAQYYSTPIL